MLLGGFPEPVLHLAGAEARRMWHDQFVATYVERDVPAFVKLDEVTTFLRFARLIAAATATLVNASRIARDVGVANDTIRRWLSVMATTFVAETIPPYWRNIRKRLVKSPKLHFVDSGLAASLLGVEDWEQAQRLNLAGALTETWVFQHLRVFGATAARRTNLHHFRSHAGDECDFVVESNARLVPIEVKVAETPRPRDAAGLGAFLNLIPEEAPFGVLLYGGAEIIPMADRIVAIPFSTFLGGLGV